MVADYVSTDSFVFKQGRNEEGQSGHKSPGAESLWGFRITAEGDEWLRW